MKVLKLINILNFKSQQRIFSRYCNIDASKFKKFCNHIIEVKYDVDKKNEDHKWPKNLLRELGGNKHIALEKLSSIAENCNEYVQLSEELLELDKLSLESSDSELLQMMEEDSKSINVEIQKEKDSIVSQLLKKSEVEDNDGIMIEIVPGVGGDEASFFAEDLLKMYENFILHKKCELKPVLMERNSKGNLRKAIVVCKPGNIYHLLRHEAGTHRVQRVPKNDKAIQTSTAAVSVIPKHINNFADLKAKDIKKSFTRSGGPGGQHANTKKTKVTLTHIPTGINVTNCDTRAQIDNLNRAMEELSYKVHQVNSQAENKKINTARFHHLTQISRSDKVRTYNFGRKEVKDHRFDLKLEILIGQYFNGDSHLEEFLIKIDKKWKNSEEQLILLQLFDEVN